MTLEELTGGKREWPDRLLALDPGETTGFSVFYKEVLARAGEVKGEDHNLSFDLVLALIDTVQPEIVIMERFALYAWKADKLSGNTFPTVEMIGVIKHHCAKKKIPIVEQMASIGKQFWTNTKLKEFGYYQTGKKHANDSIRHALYWLTFKAPERLPGDGNSVPS